MKQDYLDYLRYSVKEGFMDMEEAMALILAKDEKGVQYLMDKGDEIAEEKEEEENE